jgi:hypothetical protein
VSGSESEPPSSEWVIFRLRGDVFDVERVTGTGFGFGGRLRTGILRLFPLPLYVTLTFPLLREGSPKVELPRPSVSDCPGELISCSSKAAAAFLAALRPGRRLGVVGVRIASLHARVVRT